jgi:threonine aldolase
MKVSDFRSDTVTKPTPEMREAMFKAEVGDDVLGDDPTVKKLEDIAAQMVGKEAALFVPSGTMGNAIALKVWTSEGDEIIVEEKSHIYNYESGHLAFISRVMPRPVPSKRGIYDLDMLEKFINKRKNIHIPPTTLITLENTHNFWGGAVIPVEHFVEVKKIANRYDLKIHLDGARIFNASVASGVPVSEYARYVDSIMFCLSKGLGAPIGSIIAGSVEFIEEARRIRKLLGGGMRQVGVIAACGLVALKGVDRLREDHRRARKLARLLSEIEFIEIDPDEVETNILFFKLKHPRLDAFELTERMKEEGVLAIAISSHLIRMVTHRDVDDEDVERAVDVVKKILVG